MELYIPAAPRASSAMRSHREHADTDTEHAHSGDPRFRRHHSAPPLPPLLPLLLPLSFSLQLAHHTPFSFLFSFLSVFFFILRLRAASSVTCLPRPMLLYLSSSFSFSLLLILKYQPLHKHKLHDKGHHAGVQYCDCISGVCTPLEMGGGNVCGSSSNSRCVCHVEQKPSMPSPGTKLIAVLP